ncbi:proline dehydrogenase family protein [Thermaerobacter composti]|uniref:proline dehydrogenase n=1 Tax=Thermaerobacter composti TaxID=554949 RepID=A0ABZ0QQ39_9FIRM|nr:proline dehydrogenase family protein [Thermaerobacter composti]QBS38524.1 proline dehydrogenase [Thermaerobacter sp. FW80]WPD19617.1 proline dehydrogenase family protein [Thermaerobacter composti]
MAQPHWSRQLIFTLAGNPAVTRFVTHYGMRLGASRFVAGEDLDAALAVARRLNQEGFPLAIQFLGEHVTRPEAAEAAVEEYLRLLAALEERGIDAYLSIKPSQMGLAVDEELAYANCRRILERTATVGRFVRIEMEDSPYTERTLRLYRRLRQRFDTGHVGIVLQAYLYRSAQDLEALADLEPNIRFVKGAYNEPASVAYPNKADVDRNYRQLVQRHLERGHYAAIATHDDRLIEDLLAFIERRGIPRDRFEFQMLYGIRPQLQRAMRDRGYTMRVYVPYGREWYGYFVRRLAERPANVGFVLRNLLRG